MFHRVPERQMHAVKWLFVIGWVTLIVSSFYDPISSYVTEPDVTWSFLHLDPKLFDPELCKTVITVQGKCVPEQPYPIGPKVFWGMVIPCAIMVLLVLGHETWRRICPLSFLSQIARALGRQRQRKIVNPKTGAIRSELAKISPDSWLGKNHLYFQFGFLCTGLCVRILFINSNRWFLGSWLLLTSVAAITVGYLYAGKSWCQYFCPMAPVQTVYNGPRSLLGSKAHEGARQVTSQSMCRTVDASGKEKSACVSCQSPCFDIDAERNYWGVINKPGRKLIQYGYVGLVAGFYLYYALYSGTLDYYYSGIWNHEEDQLAQLLNPGFYIFNQAIPIPKIIAVPLTISLFVGFSYFLFSKLENLYRAYRQRINKPLSQQQARHIIFSICTFVVFNIYYMFGGRPILKLILSPVMELGFNAFVVLISTLWLYRTLGRSHETYSRESLAGSLRRQLSKLPIDFSKFLEGRSIDSLKADEVYVLATVLPGFNQESRLQVYKGLLREQLEQGNVTSADSLEALKSIRVELGVKDEEHFTVLNELSLEAPDLLDPSKVRSRENQLRIASYQQALEFQILDLLEMGIPLTEALQRRSPQIKALEQEYGITAEEGAQLLAQMSDVNSAILTKAEALINQLKELAVFEHILSNFVANPQAPIYVLLRTVAIEHKQKIVIKQLLSILEVLEHSPEAVKIAQAMSLLTEAVLSNMLIESDGSSSWPNRLSPEILAVLQAEEEQAATTQPLSDVELDDEVPTALLVSGNAIPRSMFANRQVQVITLLNNLLQDLEPLVQSAALYALEQLDIQQGREQAQQILTSTSAEYWLVRETATNILGQGDRSQMVQTLMTQINLTGRTEQRVFQKGVVQIGRGRVNDIVIDSPLLSSQHAILYLDEQGASVIDLGSPGVLHIGKQVVENDRYILKQGDVIRFSDSDEPAITVRWEKRQAAQAGTPTETFGTLEKLLLLFDINLLQSVKPEALVELARDAEVRIYPKGATICKLGEPANELLLLIDGQADVALPHGDTEVVVNHIKSGETIGEMGVLSRKPRSANVIAQADKNRVLVVQANAFEAVLRSDSEVSRSLLMVMIERLQESNIKIKA